MKKQSRSIDKNLNHSLLISVCLCIRYFILSHSIIILVWCAFSNSVQFDFHNFLAAVLLCSFFFIALRLFPSIIALVLYASQVAKKSQIKNKNINDTLNIQIQIHNLYIQRIKNCKSRK